MIWALQSPAWCKTAILHPYFSMCKKWSITPFFAKTIEGTMGLLRYYPPAWWQRLGHGKRVDVLGWLRNRDKR